MVIHVYRGGDEIDFIARYYARSILTQGNISMYGYLIFVIHILCL